MVYKVDDYLFPPDEIVEKGILSKSDIVKLRLKGVLQIESWLSFKTNWRILRNIICKTRGHILGYVNAKHKFALCTTCRRLIKIDIIWHPNKERPHASQIDRYKLTKTNGRKTKTRVYMHST